MQVWAVRRWEEEKKCFPVEMPLTVFPFSWRKFLRWATSRTTRKGTRTHFLEKLIKGSNFFNIIREDKNKFENNYSIDRIYNALL